MAGLKNVTLSIKPHMSSHREVIVGVSIEAEQGDVGKWVYISIDLWAVQAPGDSPSDKEIPLSPPLYRFEWLFSPQRPIKINNAGTITINEKRLVSVAALDEDPGFTVIQSPDINTPGNVLPRQDEVKARVKLFSGSTHMDSPVVEFGGLVD